MAKQRYHHHRLGYLYTLLVYIIIILSIWVIFTKYNVVIDIKDYYNKNDTNKTIDINTSNIDTLTIKMKEIKETIK